MTKSLMLYIVDDAADYRFLVQQVFKRFLPQYTLRLFADGLELIQHVESLITAPLASEQAWSGLTRPDLIVLDIDMPKLNGFQTLERLKQHPRWQAIPVVMMSNRSEPGYQTTASALGASSYLTKPMDITSLKEVMEQLCHQWLDE